MTPEQIERVFGRNRLKMATGDHVEVFREAVAPSERRRYTKRFLATDEADFRLWTEREWRILARLIGHGILCVPDIVQFDAGALGGMRRVQTYDAGITVDQWATLLPVSRDGVGYRSVFEDCAHWWALAHHCLAALSEIHGLQLVHLDIKGDNICIPYGPPHFDPQSSDATLYPAFARLALIDFAFSLVSGEKLGMPLPIGWQKDYDYQSPRLLSALEAGRRGDLRPTEELDWRCDLYSLAAMLRRYLPGDDCTRDERSETRWTQARYADARELIYRLRECHDRELTAVRPHPELMDITGTRVRESDLADSLARGWRLARDVAPRGGATPITPLTRVTVTTRIAESESRAATAVAPTAVTAVGTAVVRRRRARPPVAVVRRRNAALRVTPTLGDAHPFSALEPVETVLALARDDHAPLSHARHSGARRQRRASITAMMIGAFAALAAPSYLGRVVVDSPPTTTAVSAVPHPAGESAKASTPVAEASAGLRDRDAGERVQPLHGRAGEVRNEPSPDEVAAASVSSSHETLGNSATRATAGESPAASAPVPAPHEPRARMVASKHAEHPARRNAPTHASAERSVVAQASATEPATTSMSSARGGKSVAIRVAEASATPKAVRPAPGRPSTAHIAEGGAAHAAGRSIVTPMQPLAAETKESASGAENDASRPDPKVASVAPAPKDSDGEATPKSPAPVDVANMPGDAPREAREAPRPASKRNTQARHPWRLADLLGVFAIRQQRAAPVEERSMASPSVARTPSSEPTPRAALTQAAPRSVGSSPTRSTPERAREPLVVTAPMTATTAPVPRPPAPPPTRLRTDAENASPTRGQETSWPHRFESASAQRAPQLDTAPTTIDVPSITRRESAIAPFAPRLHEAVGALAETGEELVEPTAAPSQALAPMPIAQEGVDHVPATDRHLIAERIRRLAAAAYVDARPALRIASMAYAPSADRALVDAVNAAWPSEAASAPATTFATERARRLHDAARRAFAYGTRVEDVIDMETDAFAADPRDSDIAGFLAFLHLQTKPLRPDTARELALHAIASSGARRTARVDDWNTFAVASALSGRQSDATAAFLVEAALTSDLDRSCRAARRAYERFGEPLRPSVQAMLYRVQADPRARRYPACALFTY